MSNSRRNRLAAALRWLTAGIVFLATAELFARIDDAVTWKAPLFRPYANDRLMLRDSAGIRGRPDYRFEKWRMNNLGFRGADITAEPRPGTIRVVVLGASETFGLSESEGSEYPARMQSVLDSIAPGRFEVVNAALPGMMLTSMVPYYESTVARLQPTFVLVYPTPSFYLFTTDPAPAGAPAPGSRGAAKDRADRISSRIAPKAREALKGLVPAPLLNAYREWRLHRIRAEHPGDWIWTAVPDARMAAFGSDLDRLLTVITASGANPVLVTHTNRFTGCPACAAGGDRRHLVNLMLRDYPRASTHVMITIDSAANGVIRDLAVKAGAPVLEVEGRIPAGAANFADYAHFTNAGADLMARLLATGLVLLPARGHPGRTGVPAP